MKRGGLCACTLTSSKSLRHQWHFYSQNLERHVKTAGTSIVSQSKFPSEKHVEFREDENDPKEFQRNQIWKVFEVFPTGLEDQFWEY